MRHLSHESDARSLPPRVTRQSTTFLCLLSSILMNKLPQEFRFVVTGEIVDDDWQLDELLDIFKRELEVRDGLESKW